MVLQTEGKSISCCGGLLELPSTVQVRSLEVKLPKGGLLGCFIIIRRGCSEVALKLVIGQEILEVKYFQVFFYFMEILPRKLS